MTLVGVGGTGYWVPWMPPYGHTGSTHSASDTMILDAHDEEAQYTGTVTIDGGGSKTFGTSSKIGWLVGITRPLRRGPRCVWDSNRARGWTLRPAPATGHPRAGDV